MVGVDHSLYKIPSKMRDDRINYSNAGTSLALTGADFVRPLSATVPMHPQACQPPGKLRKGKPLHTFRLCCSVFGIG
jgi:hypothetical protein